MSNINQTFKSQHTPQTLWVAIVSIVLKIHYILTILSCIPRPPLLSPQPATGSPSTMTMPLEPSFNHMGVRTRRRQYVILGCFLLMISKLMNFTVWQFLQIKQSSNHQNLVMSKKQYWGIMWQVISRVATGLAEKKYMTFPWYFPDGKHKFQSLSRCIPCGNFYDTFETTKKSHYLSKDAST